MGRVLIVRRMAAREIQAVFFDVGGTLVRVAPSADVILTRTLEEFGHFVPPAEVIRRTGMDGPEVNRTDLHRAVMPPSEASGTRPSPGSRTTEAEALRLGDAVVLERLGIPATREILDALDRRFRTDPVVRLQEDALPALEGLREAGFRLGVISNASRRLPQGLRELGLDGFFESLTYSHETGVEKPHPEIFRKALRRMGVAGPQAAHVGDSYAADVVGARGVGIAPILVDRDGTGPDRDCAVVRRLTEVPAVLAAGLAKG